jgi:hypothetical protein
MAGPFHLLSGNPSKGDEIADWTGETLAWHFVAAARNRCVGHPCLVRLTQSAIAIGAWARGLIGSVGFGWVRFRT